jgi:hypothetical protein
MPTADARVDVDLPAGSPAKPAMSGAASIDAANACGDAGRGVVNSSPSMISATMCCGTLRRSS